MDHKCSIVPAAALAIAAALVVSSSATPHKATWNAWNDYQYHVLQMPDIDQRWGTVPGFGSMYCAPTAALNLAMYAANHGFPQVQPGPNCWGCLPLDQQSINDLISALLTMGIFMGTTADDGTSASGTFSGLTSYLGAPNIPLDVYGHFTSTYSAPQMDELAAHAIDGSIVMFCFGRYVIVAQSGSLIEVSNRNTGHCVTMVRAENDGQMRILWSRDPAQDENPDDLAMQSIFTNRNYTPVDDYLVFRDSPFFSRFMTALEHPVGDGIVRLIDSAQRVRPTVGHSFTPNHVQVHKPFGSFTVPANPIPIPLPIDPLGPGFAIADSAEYWLDSSVILLARSGGVSEVRRLNPFSGETLLLGTFSNATKIEVGRHGDVFVLAGNQLFHREARPLDDPNAQWDVLALHMPTGAPIFPDAMAYDDASDELVLLSSAQRVMVRAWDFGVALPHYQTYETSLEIPMSSNMSMAIDPRDQMTWFVSDASTALYGLALPVPGAPLEWEVFGHPAIPEPRSISIGANGRLYVSIPDVGDEVLVAMVPGPDDRWMPDPNWAFDGIRVGEGFRVSRGRTNYDPALHDGPEWLNVDPDQEPLVFDGDVVPDCYADLNADFVVDVSDLLILLGEWGTPGSIADLNHDGTVDVSDLLILLSSWGDCPD